jgi:Leucine Rich repeat
LGSWRDGSRLDEEALRALQPGLRSNRNLKELRLSHCDLQDEGLGLIVDALVENTTMNTLHIDNNGLTAGSLGHITRLVEFKQLKNVHAQDNDVDVDNVEAMANFFRVLHQRTSLEVFQSELYDMIPSRVLTVNNVLARNTSLRHANELLAPRQPRTGLPIGSKSGIWCDAFAKMGRSTAGGSAIFDILQKRPALLEKQLPRPPHKNHHHSSQKVVVLAPAVRPAATTVMRRDKSVLYGCSSLVLFKWHVGFEGNKMLITLERIPPPTNLGIHDQLGWQGFQSSSSDLVYTTQAQALASFFVCRRRTSLFR